MENEEQNKENHEHNESSIDSSVFLKIAEELKKDTENLGKKQNEKSESVEEVKDKPQEKQKQYKKETKVKENKKIEQKQDDKTSTKSIFSRVPGFFRKEIGEKPKENKKRIVSKEKQPEIIQPKQPPKEIVKVIYRNQPNKQERIVIKEVPRLRSKINNLRNSFIKTANELKGKLGAVNFHQDAEIEFLKKEANDLNKIIPFLIERIDAIEGHSNLIRNSANRKIFRLGKEVKQVEAPIRKISEEEKLLNEKIKDLEERNNKLRSSANRKFWKLGKEVKESEGPIRRIVEEEKILDEKIDKNTLRFNQKLLQEMAESKRMIEEEKYELKKHLFDTLAASIDDLTRKKEEADKNILLEIDKLRSKIEEGDKNVNESLVSKIVQLRHKLNESKIELQGEITNELEELRKTVERRVERKVEQKIEEQQRVKEEKFKKFNPIREAGELRVFNEIKELESRPSIEVKQVKELPEVNYFSKFNETIPPMIGSHKFYDQIKKEEKVQEKNKGVVQEKESKQKDIDFSTLPQLKEIPFEKPEFFENGQKLTNSTRKEKIPIEKKIKQEIKESYKSKPFKLVKRKVPKMIYLEEPRVKELLSELNDIKKFAREAEQYFLKEVSIKKEVHEKNIHQDSNECTTITKNLSSIRSLMPKVKE